MNRIAPTHLLLRSMMALAVVLAMNWFVSMVFLYASIGFKGVPVDWTSMLTRNWRPLMAWSPVIVSPITLFILLPITLVASLYIYKVGWVRAGLIAFGVSFLVLLIGDFRYALTPKNSISAALLYYEWTGPRLLALCLLSVGVLVGLDAAFRRQAEGVMA